MKKSSKFLALTLSSLTLISNVGFVEAVKPKTSHNRHSQKARTSSSILDNVVKFKSQIPKGGIWVETTIGDTCITKEKLEAVNTEKMTKLASNFASQHFKGCIPCRNSFNISLANTFEQYQTIISAMSVFEKNRIDEEDLIDFLCIAHRNKTEIPDKLNFNSVQMLCYDKISIFNLLQDGEHVFKFHILTGSTINTPSEFLSQTKPKKEKNPGNLIKQILEFKKEVLASIMSMESEMGDTRIEKKEIDSLNSHIMLHVESELNLNLHRPSFLNMLSTSEIDLINSFELCYTMLTTMIIHEKNKIEKNDLMEFLCIAQRNGVEIPDVLNFNSAYMYCSDRNAIFSLKKDGKIVFVFLIPMDE